MPDFDTLRRFAGATPDTDTDLLKLCMEAAKEWFSNAGVPPLKDNALYDLGVYQLATHYFDNRGVIAENGVMTQGGGVGQVPMGVFSIMHQLRSTPAESEASP